MSERNDWQVELAGLYQAELVTTLGLVESVYPYLITDPRGVSPVVAVSAAGTNFFDSLRQGYGRAPLGYYVDVFAFVLHSRRADSYTNQDAEAVLSNASQAIARVNADSDAIGPWSSIEYREPTRIIAQDIAGTVYLIESLRLELKK